MRPPDLSTANAFRAGTGAALPVFVYGSCVARDTFEILDDRHLTLAHYVARQSVISVGNHADPALASAVDLPSAFQRRMVAGDVAGDLEQKLLEIVDSPPRLLVWDLTDERGGVYAMPDGSYVTRSVDVLSGGLEERVQSVGGRLIAFGSDEHFALWGAAVDRLRTIIRRSPIAAIAVLALPWASMTEDGNPTPPSFDMEPALANELYERYYDYVRDIPEFHVFSVDPQADGEHRWGAAPFHYTRSTYERVGEALRAYLAAQAPHHRGARLDHTVERARRHLSEAGLATRPGDVEEAQRLAEGVLLLSDGVSLALSPEPDWDWQGDRRALHRFHSLIWTDVLRRTGDGAYPELLDLHRRLIRSWLRRVESSLPDSTTKVAQSPATASQRVRALTAAIAAHGAEAWATDALAEHGVRLADALDRRLSPHNRVHAAVGLVIAGHVLDVQTWIEKGSDTFLAVVRDGVDRDGATRSGSISHHEATAQLLRDAAVHLEIARALPDEVIARLIALPRLLVHATQPDGRLAPIGETRSRRPRDLGDASLSYARSRGKRGHRPISDSAVFHGAGLYFGRSSWDANASYVSMRFGVSGTTLPHGHDDGGSITFSVADQSLLVDRGPASPDRPWRTRGAHSVVVSQADDTPDLSTTSLLTDLRRQSHDWLVVRRVGSVHWVRGLYFSRTTGAALVVDRVGAEVPWEQRWQLASGLALEDSSGWLVATGASHRFRMTTVALKETAGAPVQLRVRPLGEASYAAAAGAPAKDPETRVTLLVADRATAPVHVELHTGPDSAHLQLTHGRVRESVRIVVDASDESIVRLVERRVNTITG